MLARCALLVLAAPAAALVRGSFTWRVPSERLAPGEPIESAPFDCAGQRWTLKLSPRTGKRCGVELRYAAKDVGDAVDAAFTLFQVDRIGRQVPMNDGVAVEVEVESFLADRCSREDEGPER